MSSFTHSRCFGSSFFVRVYAFPMFMYSPFRFLYVSSIFFDVLMLICDMHVCLVGGYGCVWYLDRLHVPFMCFFLGIMLLRFANILALPWYAIFLVHC